MIEANYIEGDTRVNAENINGFGNPENFIREINLPRQMSPGEEYIPVIVPIIKIQRTSSSLKEFLSSPYFSVTKRIRMQFHWEGVTIVGSNMEEPNIFILPIPENGSNNWYFKIICKSDAAPGFKPLYISFDTLHENIFLKYLLKSFKILSFISLLCVIIIGIFYNDTVIGEKLFFGDILSDKSMIGQTLSPFLVALILFVAFWKNISKAFESIYKKEKPEYQQNLTQEGVKGFSRNFGITVLSPNDGLFN